MGVAYQRAAKYDPRPQVSLARKLGKFQATMLTVGTMVGAGIFASIGPAAEKAGGGLLLSMLLAGVVALCSGLGGAQLASRFPEAGGAFLWARKLGFKWLGFLAGVCFLGKEIVGTSVIALTFATYLNLLIPRIPVNMIGASAVILFTVLNYFGIEETAKAIIFFVVAKTTLLLLLTGLIFSKVIPGNFLPVMGNGVPGLFAGAALFFFSFEGFQRTAVVAGEIKEPRKTLPFAILVGFAISLFLFLSVGTVTLGILGSHAVSDGKLAVFKAAETAIGPWGGKVAILAAIFATLNVIVSSVLGASRVTLAMGKAEEIPIWFSQVHPKFRVPGRAVLVFGLIVAALTYFFDLRSLLEITSVFSLIWFGITNFAAIKLEKRYRFFPVALSWIGMLGCGLFLVTLPLRAILIALVVIAIFAALRRSIKTG